MAGKPLLNVIYPQIVGQVIRDCGRDGRYFYLQTEVPGHPGCHALFRIEWVNEHGEPIPGYPRLVERKDARIIVQPAGAKGEGKY